jgi:type IV pilus assembly protein PilW
MIMSVQSKGTRVRGFSMVELMVAMVIGLMGIIIIFQVFEVSESIKRTTTSGGDAQQNGAVALYVLEHDLRNSGMSFNDTKTAGCSIVGYDSTIVPPDLPAVGATILMAPARITPGAGPQVPDALTVFYGSQTHSASAVSLNVDLAVSTDPLRVLALSGTMGFNPGDLIIVMEPQIPPAPAKPCSLMEVTSVGNDTKNTLLYHDAGNYNYIPPGATTPLSVPSRFNKPGGLGVTYIGKTAGTQVYNIGNIQNQRTVPVYSNYQVANSSLTITSAFTIGTPPVVADNIVHMRALYGLDDGVNNTTVPFNATYAAGDGIVDRFVDAAAGVNWQYVIAVRIAVVARSALKEKPAAGAGAACDTTQAEPTWSGTPWAAAPLSFNTRLDVSADPDWQCYRYRVFEATVPLRNWVWSSS